MKADLHVHSVYSDGTYTPIELVMRAKEAGLDLICITDHDNLYGEADKETAMKQCGLPYLRGWEISTSTDRKVHILGYHCKVGGKAYENFLEKRKEEALERTEKMLRLINAHLKLNLTVDDVRQECCPKENVLHSIHLARAIGKKLGRTGNCIDVYSEFLAKGMPAYVSPSRPAPEEAIDIIHELGGVAVLAHPGRMRAEGKLELFERLLKAGIEGIECYYTTHTAEETEDYLAFARKHKLFVTGGSDFHFENARPVFGKPDYIADENFLARVMPS